MKQELIKLGKGALRWLLFALLFAGVTAETFQEPRSIYRIEEVFSSEALSFDKIIFEQSFHRKAHFSPNLSRSKNLQSGQFRILSERLSQLSGCAMSSAPQTLLIVRNSTGHMLKSKLLTSGDDFISFA